MIIIEYNNKNEKTVGKLKKLSNEYSNLNGKIGRAKNYVHTIHMTDTRPHKDKLYPIPKKRSEKTDRGNGEIGYNKKSGNTVYQSTGSGRKIGRKSENLFGRENNQ